MAGLYIYSTFQLLVLVLSTDISKDIQDIEHTVNLYAIYLTAPVVYFVWDILICLNPSKPNFPKPMVGRE